MGVSYHNPGALMIGGILAAAVCLIAFILRKKPDISKSLRAANTRRLKEHPLYKRKMLEAKVLRILAMAGIIISLVAAVFLTSRPYKSERVKDTVSRRDIFLCIDTSSSNYSGVKELVQEFKEIAAGLDGDRIGISLFNTSSIQYVPMTDDYEFALRRLDALEGYLAAQEEFMTDFAQKYDSVYEIPDSERARYEELNRIMASFDSGVTAGYELKGTSAIGEGLASCLFSFPELTEEERTRVIIFVTDNRPELLDAPLVTLMDAAKMCEFDKVKVLGICPVSGADAGAAAQGGGGNGADETGDEGGAGGSGTGDENGAGGTGGSGTGGGSGSGADGANVSEMREASELTGGKFYGPGTALTAQMILDDIKAIENQSTKTTTATVETDTPQIWFIVLVAGFVVIAATTIYLLVKRGIGRGQLRRGLPALLLLLAMLAGIAAVGIRPMYLSPDAEIRTGNLDVAFVVDMTISMWAEDHKGGTRIDGVRSDIRTIMEALPGSSFSLITFDNGAQILTPYTQDIIAVEDMLDDLSMPSYATSQGSSLNTSYEALHMMVESAARKEGERKTVVFLFSDGETTNGAELMSFRDLGKLIDSGAVLGYGTESGGPMYYPGRGYIRNNSNGETARSRIDEAALRQIAGDLSVPYINETEDIGSSLAGRLRSVRLMSREAAFASGSREGYVETYHYFAMFVEALLLIWLYLTIFRGGVA